MHRSKGAALLALFLFLPLSPVFEDTTYYVSPDGKAGNPGTQARPFRSIQDAILALRKVKKDKPLTVIIAPGTYPLTEPIVFLPEDSGRAEAPITYRAAETGKAIITGGIRIGPWRKEGDLWRADVGQVKSGELYFHQLFVNGRRARRAVTPNTFYLRTAGPIKPLGDRMKARQDRSTKLGFRFRPGDFKRWDNLDDVTIKLYHSWTASLHWIADLDLKKRTVKFTNPSAWPEGYWEQFERYRIENYFEALDSPGEWYLDRAKGALFYHPLPGEKPDTIQAVAPRLTQLVVFKGDPESGRFVEHLTLRGLSFQHADWRFDRKTMVDGQAHAPRVVSPITAHGLRHSVIEDCEVAHVGSHAIRLDEGCMDNRVVRCHIHDCGGGGVYVGPEAKVGYMPPQENLKVQRNVIENNFIHDITHVLGGSIGIWVGSSSFNQIRHNEICDFDYTGISVGWCWMRDTDIFQRGNIIEYNHIHHNGGDLLSDNGGIYVLGYSPDSVIRGNRIHHFYHYPYINDSRGIYLDGNTSEYVVENNLVHDIGSFGITFKGQHNRIRNNIFAFCGDSGFNRLFKAHAKDFEYEQSSLIGNIVYQAIDVMTSGYYAPQWTEIDRNLYWSAEKGSEVRFNDWSSRILKDHPEVVKVPFARWKELGRDKNSVAADPLFRDAQGRDFRLRKDSPAGKIGFKVFDFQKAGLYGDASWTSLPETIKRKPHEFAPPPRQVPFSYDFESYEEDEIPVIVGQVYEEGPCRLRVTERTSPGGKRCLKFSDGDSSRSWYPHWCVHLHRRDPAAVSFSCDLMNDKQNPARFSFEFRDYTTPKWTCGPAVAMSPDGTLTASGKELCRIEPGTWAHVEVRFKSGPGSPKTFSVTVKPAGAGEKTIQDLPFKSQDFTTCTWLGFSSLDMKEAAYYLDNINLKME